MKIEPKILLRDPRVKEEIDRHKWLESEKVGRDIGFDNAADDWISNYSEEWVDVHMVDKNRPSKLVKIKKNGREGIE